MHAPDVKPEAPFAMKLSQYIISRMVIPFVAL